MWWLRFLVPLPQEKGECLAQGPSRLPPEILITALPRPLHPLRAHFPDFLMISHKCIAWFLSLQCKPGPLLIKLIEQSLRRNFEVEMRERHPKTERYIMEPVL